MKANLKENLPQEGTGYSLAGESLGGPSGPSCPSYSGGGQDRYRYRAPCNAEIRKFKPISEKNLSYMQNSGTLNLIFDKDREVDDMVLALYANRKKMSTLEDQTSFALQEHLLEAIMIVEKVASFAVGPQDQLILNKAANKVKEVLMDIMRTETKQIETRSQLLVLRRELLEKKALVRGRDKSTNDGHDFEKQIHPASTNKETKQKTGIKEVQVVPSSIKVSLSNTDLVSNSSCVASDANNYIVAEEHGDIPNDDLTYLTEKPRLSTDQKPGDMAQEIPINKLEIGTMKNRAANKEKGLRKNGKLGNIAIDFKHTLQELQKLSDSTTKRRQLPKTSLLEIHKISELKTPPEGLSPYITFDNPSGSKIATGLLEKYIQNTLPECDSRVDKSLGNRNVETKQIFARLESMSDRDDMANQVHSTRAVKKTVQRTEIKRDQIELLPSKEGGSKSELNEVNKFEEARQYVNVINEKSDCRAKRPEIDQEPRDEIQELRINKLEIGTMDNVVQVKDKFTQKNKKLGDTAIDIKHTLEELQKLSDCTTKKRQVQNSTLLEIHKLSELTTPIEVMAPHVMFNKQLDSHQTTGFIGKYAQNTKEEPQIQKDQVDFFPSKDGGSKTELNFSRKCVACELNNSIAMRQPSVVISKKNTFVTGKPDLSIDQEPVDMVQSLHINNLEIGEMENYAAIKQKVTKEIKEKLENTALDIKQTLKELQNLSDSIRRRQVKETTTLEIRNTQSELTMPTKDFIPNITIKEQIDSDKLTNCLENYVQKTKQECDSYKDKLLQSKNDDYTTSKKTNGGDKRNNDMRSPSPDPEPVYDIWYVENQLKKLALKHVEKNINSVQSKASDLDHSTDTDGFPDTDDQMQRGAVYLRPKPLWWSTEIEELRRLYGSARRQLSRSRRRKERNYAAEAQLRVVLRDRKRSLRNAIKKAKAKGKQGTSEST